MFHRHFDDHIHHSHGGPATMASDAGRFAAGVPVAEASAAGKAACSTAGSSDS